MPLRVSYRTQVMACVALALVGVALLALPSNIEGPVLVPVSEGHGLSALDTMGTAALAVGVTWLEVLVVIRLPRLGLTPRVTFGLGLFAGLGVGLVVASAYGGFFWWWAIGAVLLGAALLLLALLMSIR